MTQAQEDRISREIKGIFLKFSKKNLHRDIDAEIKAKRYRERSTLVLQPQDIKYLRA